MLLRIGLAASAMLATAGCTALGNEDKPAPHVRTDHSTAAPIANSVPDTGPTAGAMSESWHIDTKLAGGRFGQPGTVSTQVVGGQLLVASRSGLDLYDAQTGRPRWHYREPGRQLAGYALTAGKLVAMTGKPDNGIVHTDR